MTATSVTFSIRTAVRKVMPYMMEMREYFHARPETSGNEFDTCKTIFRELSLLGAEDIRIIAGTGVTALIRGALPGPTVLLRAKQMPSPWMKITIYPMHPWFPASCMRRVMTDLLPTC